MDINVDGGDAATVETAVANTLVIGLHFFNFFLVTFCCIHILVSRT